MIDKRKIIEELRARCFRARVPLYQVCRGAGVSPATTSRWMKNPEMMQATTLAKLEAELDRIEAERAA